MSPVPKLYEEKAPDGSPPLTEQEIHGNPGTLRITFPAHIKTVDQARAYYAEHRDELFRKALEENRRLRGGG